jgi:hypothetical protein
MHLLHISITQHSCWLPKNQSVRKLYESHISSFHKGCAWDTNVMGSEYCSCNMFLWNLHLAVWSPCNGFIAIPCQDDYSIVAMDVLDSVTFQTTSNPQIPTGHVSKGSMALIFSPDSHILTCFSCVGIYGDDLCIKSLCVISWDLQTGGIASIIRWQAPEQDLMRRTLQSHIQQMERWLEFSIGMMMPTDAADISICNVASGTYMHSHSLNVDVPTLKQHLDSWRILAVCNC